MMTILENDSQESFESETDSYEDESCEEECDDEYCEEESEDECSEEEYEYEESEMEYEDEESETEYDDEGSEEEYQDEESEEEYQDEESDEEYEAHRLNSNQNNPNNDEYWRLRGWSQRPDDWRGSCSKIIEIFLFFAICRAHLRELGPVQTKSAQEKCPHQRLVELTEARGKCLLSQL
jgi:hypothetical protein